MCAILMWLGLRHESKITNYKKFKRFISIWRQVANGNLITWFPLWKSILWSIWWNCEQWMWTRMERAEHIIFDVAMPFASSADKPYANENDVLAKFTITVHSLWCLKGNRSFTLQMIQRNECCLRLVLMGNFGSYAQCASLCRSCSRTNVERLS